MKIFIIFILCFLCATPSSAIKMTDFTEDTSPTSDDLIWTTNSPSSSPSDRKVTLSSLLLWMATQDWTITGTWDWSGATVTWPDTISTTTFVGALRGNADTASGLKLPDDSTVTLPSASGSGVVYSNSNAWTYETTLTITISGFDASKVLASDGSGNATTLSSQNVITTGYVDGRVNVTVSTSSPVTVSGSSGFYINGSNSVKTFNLPEASVGLAFCFANVLYANALTIHPASGDYIVLAGESNDSSDVVSSGAATDQICLLAIDSTYWRVTASTGTWTND